MNWLFRKYKRYISIQVISLFFILCLAIFFRFYNIPNRYGFDPDPTRDALVVYEAATHFKIPLIGALSGIAPFTFGPWYYYQLILVQILFPFSFTPWIYIGLASVIVCIFMYKIGVLLESKWFGLLLALFAAISPSETGQTQGLSNPNLIPLFSVIVVWLFIKLIKQNLSEQWIFLWGAVLSIGINIHYQMIGLCILPVFFFYVKRKNIFQNILIFILGFFIPWTPLITFNILYHWHTLTGITYFITTGRHGTYIPNSWKIYFFNFWIPYWSYVLGVSKIIGILTLIFSFGIIIFSYFKKRLKRIYILLVLAFVVNFILLRYFLSQRDYYYYLFLHSFIFIFFAFALWQLRKFLFGKIMLLILLVTLVVGMISADRQSLSSRKDQRDIHKTEKKLVTIFPNNSFTLYSCDDRQKNFAQGVEFFLLHDNYYQKKGKNMKIGFAYPDCLEKFSEYSPAGDLKDVVYLGDISDKKLLSYGFHPVTPAKVYFDTVAWWQSTKQH